MERKGTSKGKKSGPEKGKTQPQTSKCKNKGKVSGKGKQAKGQPAQGKGKGKGKNKKSFTGGESNKDWKSALVGAIPAIQTHEMIHTLFRAFGSWSWNVLFVQLLPMASR